MKKILKNIFFGIILFLVILLCYFFIGTPPRAKKISWGVNFSQGHAQYLGLDWKENYTALLDDLKVKNLKVAAHWDLIEPERDNYDFQDLDWQIIEAQKREAKILLVIGMKTPRWPECHIPKWAAGLSKEEQQAEILKMLEKTVVRYNDYGTGTIWAWQVENEPFFPFGECPWVDKNFLKKEINLVKSLDHYNRPIIISDSGEGSFWINSARFGDIVGTTMYKKVWFRQLKRYVFYPFTPTFYWRKAQLIKWFFKKDVISTELQAEPWCPTLLYDCSSQEQEKTMNLERFKYNIEFAERTGLSGFYLWGGEWWYWMKEKQNKPEIWNEAKKLFQI